MKKVYFIGGTMGVGKTTVCREMKMLLDNSVFLDGDTCWDSRPSHVTDETKAMVIDNIRYLLNSFIRCGAYDNIIFCWVMHEQSIIDFIVEGLDLSRCAVGYFSLTADESVLRARLEKDISDDIRTNDVIERSISRISMYQSLNTVKIDTSNMTPSQVAYEIIARMGRE